jgi:glycosyltransferase involved in cell wall biosynthesis
MKLAVCVPISWDFVPTPFLISFSRLFRPSQLKAMRALGIERYFHLFNRAFPLDYNRNTLVRKSVELEADWVLFLDADMTFPPDLVPSLLENAIESKSAIVSGCYFKKLPPHQCVSAIRRDAHDPQLLSPIDTGEKGLVECDVIGMGAALIHSSVFEAVAHPWFEYEVYEKTGERTVTEDVPFCAKAKQAGFTIMTDTRLACGHVRQVEVGESDWLDWRARAADRLNGEGRTEEAI